jgi:hypothetical protein
MMMIIMMMVMMMILMIMMMVMVVMTAMMMSHRHTVIAVAGVMGGHGAARSQRASRVQDPTWESREESIGSTPDTRMSKWTEGKPLT